MDGLVLHDASLSVPSLALDAERDPAMGELGLAGMGIGGEVDDPARAFLEPPVLFVLGAMLGGTDLGSLPVQGREVGEQREPIGLHRRHDVVRLAIFLQMPCGVVLGMQGIEGDDPSGQGEPGGQSANGGDLVALVRDRFLSEDQSAAVLGGGDEEVLPVGVLPCGARGWTSRRWPRAPRRRFAGRPTCAPRGRARRGPAR